MPISQVAAQSYTILDAVLGVGFAGLIITEMVTMRVTKTKLEAVKDTLIEVRNAVKDQNGTLDKHGERLTAIETRCEERYKDPTKKVAP